jgi:hypothetical protein
VRRTLLTGALAAVVFIAAAPAAGAAKLHGRILGRPHVDGAQATVPVLLDGASMRVLGARRAEVLVTVPARSGFRTATRGRSSAAGTRLGDVVSARIAALRGRASIHARYLKLERRSTAPAFGELESRLAAAAAGAEQALPAAGRIADAEQQGPPDPGQLRFSLLGVRTNLNLLISDLRDQARGIDDLVADLRGSSPPPADALLQRLGEVAAALRGVAQTLEDGVAGLDEFINSIGGLGGGTLPAGSTDAVGQVVGTVLQTLDQLGAPSLTGLPSPLGGLPVAPPRQ